MFERGKRIGEGAEPLSPLYSPLQPLMPVVIYQWFWLERGQG